MKKRLFFNKCEEMKYISHLDLLRFMDRILRKSGIPIKYSQGFHPRPKISLGNPISLGTDAYNEPMDIELSEDMTNEELFKKLNEETVKGFKFTKVIDIDGKSSITDEYKDMKFVITGDGSSIEKIKALLEQDEILLTKEKRGKVTTRDLKPRVKYCEIAEGENKITLVLENMSPNSMLKIAGVELSNIEITKYGI